MKIKKVVKKILSFIFIAALITADFSFFSLYSLNKTLALDNQILASINTPIKIFDNQNNDISSNYSLNAPFIKLDQLPTHTIAAFTSIEDDKFYEHNGLNYGRIIKALIKNIKAGRIVEKHPFKERQKNKQKT